MDYKIKTAVGVVVNSKNQVLLGRCKTDDARNGLLCFPGGGIDGKEDVFTAALREVKEETNIIGTISRMTFVIHQEVPFIGFVLLKDTGDNSEIVWNDEYEQDNPGGWYDLNKLPSEEIMNNNLDVLKTMGLVTKPVYYNKNNESMSNLKELIESGKSVEYILNLKEAGKWNHDHAGKYGGSSGSFSKFTDGVQSLVIYLDQKKQKWMYTAQVNNDDIKGAYSSGKVTGEIPSKYTNDIEDGDKRAMTKFAKTIIK
jgi:8-oxo-dGTP pyrophosphatase MutT (NUDIX family)